MTAVVGRKRLAACHGGAFHYADGMSLPPLFDRLRLPAIGAPLFIVSNPDLVIAQCKAGIVGSFPALNARPQSLLDEWLHRITEELAAWDRDRKSTRLNSSHANISYAVFCL